MAKVLHMEGHNVLQCVQLFIQVYNKNLSKLGAWRPMEPVPEDISIYPCSHTFTVQPRPGNQQPVLVICRM